MGLGTLKKIHYIKDGVSLAGVSPEISFIIPLLCCLYTAVEEELVITSCCEGEHSPGSLHYIGHAIDLRTRNLKHHSPEQMKGLLTRVLPSDFDIVIERTHIHIEHQPKKNR